MNELIALPPLQLADAAAKAAKQERADEDLAMVSLEAKKSKVRTREEFARAPSIQRERQAHTRCNLYAAGLSSVDNSPAGSR